MCKKWQIAFKPNTQHTYILYNIYLIMVSDTKHITSVTDILKLCTLKLDLTICKITDDDQLTELIKNFDEDELEDGDVEFDNGDGTNTYIYPLFNKKHKQSQSYYGPKDYHLTYSCFDSQIYDDPDTQILNIECLYETIQQIKQTVTNLKDSPKYKNVALMSPHARSLDSDNIVFIIGFDAANS